MNWFVASVSVYELGVAKAVAKEDVRVWHRRQVSAHDTRDC